MRIHSVAMKQEIENALTGAGIATSRLSIERFTESKTSVRVSALSEDEMKRIYSNLQKEGVRIIYDLREADDWKALVS